MTQVVRYVVVVTTVNTLGVVVSARANRYLHTEVPSEGVAVPDITEAVSLV